MLYSRKIIAKVIDIIMNKRLPLINGNTIMTNCLHKKRYSDPIDRKLNRDEIELRKL